MDQPIRIAFCHYTADVCGGSDRCLLDLVLALPRDRFESLVLLKKGDPLAKDYRAAGIQVAEVRVVPPRRALDPGALANFFLSFWPSVFTMAGHIRRFRADVVHVNTSLNLQGHFAAKVAGRPLVAHVRELGGGRVDGIILRIIGMLATRGVAISNAVAETMGACGDRVRIVHDGIDLSEYDDLPDQTKARLDKQLHPTRPIVTVVGRMEHWKGQHVLVEAMPVVLEKFPDTEFLFVGGPAKNKPEYLPALKTRCEALGVASSATFTGIRNDIPILMAASDVLALPTCTAEPFGRTVIEAMAARCPVVATAAGGPLDTMVDGETGYLVPPDDPEALAQAIIRLLDDRDAARQLGEQGRARAYDAFSLDRHTADMAALFEDVVGEVTR